MCCCLMGPVLLRSSFTEMRACFTRTRWVAGLARGSTGNMADTVVKLENMGTVNRSERNRIKDMKNNAIYMSFHIDFLSKITAILNKVTAWILKCQYIETKVLYLIQATGCFDIPIPRMT